MGGGITLRPNMRDKVNEKLPQSQIGHKTLVMPEHYSGHKIAGDQKRTASPNWEVMQKV